MTKVTALFGLISIILLWGCAGVVVYRSSWQQPSFLQDQENERWSKNMVLDVKSGMVYGIFNDADTLYVRMKIADQMVQRKILKAGLTFWIDPEGKRNKDLGIVFPVGHNGLGSARRTDRNTSEEGDPRIASINHHAINRKFESGMEPMHLIGFFGKGSKETANNINKLGVNGMLRIDEHLLMLYELQIPLDKIFTAPEEYLADSTMVFAFGFETGTIDFSSNRGRGPESGMKSGGGGRRPGGGPGGGRGTNSQPDQKRIEERQTLSEPGKFWVRKTALATHEESNRYE